MKRIAGLRTVGSRHAWGWRMKLNVEIECTPEEARRAVGLPDLTPVHDRYIAMMLDTMQGVVKPEMVETMMRSWSPMGEAGMQFWKKLIDGAAGRNGG